MLILLMISAVYPRKVTWRVPKAKFQGLGFDQLVSREIGFLGIKVKLQFYPQGCPQFNNNWYGPVLHLLGPENSPLYCRVWWNERNIVGDDAQLLCQGRWHQWQCQTYESDVKVTIAYSSVGGEQARNVLSRWLKSELSESEAKANRLAAEVDRCHALITAGSHQAAERECRLTISVVKIQAKWRQVLTRRWFLQERSERAWRRKQAKFQAETPYDAILVSIALLARCFLMLFISVFFPGFCKIPRRQTIEGACPGST